MWKLRWMIEVIFSQRVWRLLRDKLERPLIFYLNLVSRFVSDRSRFVSISLMSGSKFYVYRFMDLFKLYEIFIEDDYEPNMDQANVILDIGGNKGYFSLRISELFPSATYYCYEPEPTNLRSLRRLLNDNGIKYYAYQEGVGAEDGQLELFIDPKNDGGHSLFRSSESLNSITVEIVTLEIVLQRIPDGEKVDLMKLDCEGAEKEIILSMGKELAKRIENIYYEPTYSRYDPDILNRHLKSLGYSVSNRNGIFRAIKS